MLPALFAKTAACIDPFIYSLNHPKIRQEILYRLYNSFLLSTGRRGESLNSDSARAPDWKISGSARITRQGLLYQTGTQHGRVGSLASFRRFNRTHRNPQSGIGGSSGREDMRRSLSLSSAESRTVNAEGLETADIIACMRHRNQELQGSQFHSPLSTTEMSCVAENNLALTSLNQPNSPTIFNLATSALTSSSLWNNAFPVNNCHWYKVCLLPGDAVAKVLWYSKFHSKISWGRTALTLIVSTVYPILQHN